MGDDKHDFGLALFMIAYLSICAFGIIMYKQPKEVNVYNYRIAIKEWQERGVKMKKMLVVTILSVIIGTFVFLRTMYYRE